jgi:hypothetical protein
MADDPQPVYWGDPSLLNADLVRINYYLFSKLKTNLYIIVNKVDKKVKLKYKTEDRSFLRIKLSPFHILSFYLETLNNHFESVVTLKYSLIQACMKQLLSTSVAMKRSNPEIRLWKFYMNLAGTVMPQQSVQEMAK